MDVSHKDQPGERQQSIKPQAKELEPGGAAPSHSQTDEAQMDSTDSEADTPLDSNPEPQESETLADDAEANGTHPHPLLIFWHSRPWAALTAVSLLLAWGFFMLQLRYHWGGETYYNYGWGVPLLTLYLFWQRFQSATKPRPSEAVLKVSLLVFWALLLLVFPFRLVNEANPFWRVPLWGQGLILVAALQVYFLMLGRWSWFRHFLFPSCFLLTMIPWPYQIEVKIVQALTRLTAESTVIYLRFLGEAASLQGNIIDVDGSRVGVDEACSGIRSLQSLGMIALFLGEFFRLTVARRLSLIVAALVAVFLFNSVRSFALTMIVLKAGQEGFDQWHDTLGIVTYLLSVICLYFAGEFLHHGGDAPEVEPWNVKRLPRFTFRIAAVGVALAILPQILVQGWFLFREMRVPEAANWKIDWPSEDSKRFQFLEISDSVKSILSYDYGKRAQIYFGRDMVAEIYHYGYTGKNKMASVSSYGHSPTICVESAGGQLKEEFEPLLVHYQSFTIPFKHYLFDVPVPGREERVPLQVFWCVWEKRNMGADPASLASLDRWQQVKLAVKGRRDYSRQVLLVAIPGDAQPGTVRVAFHQLMKRLVRMGPTG